MNDARTRRVSFDDEPLIVVDESNRIVDYRPKVDVHAGRGILHRAFSVFLFDAQGRLLLQQRSAAKPLWPLIWANSCCSHPRRGETEAQAAKRRVHEELGLETDLAYVYTFTYHAAYGDVGSEHEICSVFLGHADGAIVVNENEIAAVRWVEPEALDEALARQPDRYSPWLHMEWVRLRTEFRETLRPYVRA